MASGALPCDFNTGDIIDSRLVVDSRLGEGSFGMVYRVHDRYDFTPYALKLLKLWTIPAHETQKLLARFEQEYETGLIDSPFLVKASGYGSVNGNPYILMEYCPGGDILQGVRRGFIDLPSAAEEILLGLKALHVNGKVHRDLKPENVLIKADGIAALTDFGIAGDRNKRMTELGVNGIPTEQMGTYAFMPPEQINPRRGDATVLPTTDLFAFGVVIYQLLTGKYPFGTVDSQSELYHYVMRSKNGEWDREALKGVAGGTQWERLIEECLQPDFTRRVQSADDAIGLIPASASRQNRRQENDYAVPAVNPVVNGVALRVMQGEEYGKVYHLTDIIRSTGRRILTVGRQDPDVNNIVSLKEDQSNYISRKHCTLEYYPESDSWIIRDGQWDLGGTSRWRISTNGTYVGAREVPVSGMPLALGDIISVGDAKLRMEGY
ncbi:MAG: protein kinase [Muribaculaceae bacterium]|nr:protein kinase [Muribaculaceae bacterium]